MKKFGEWVSLDTSWRFLSTVVIVGAGLSLLLVSHLETLLPGYSSAEVATISGISTSAIIDNPINAPYKITTLVVNKVIDNQLLAARLSAALFGALTIGLFYLGIRHWHATRTAFLATILFACSAWFLHVARLGTADILLPFSLLLLAICSYWIATAEHTKFSYFAALLAIGIAVYTPGMIWFIGLGIILRHKDVRLIKRRLPTSYQAALYSLLIVLVIAPLAYSAAKHPHIIMSLLGLPEHWPNILEIIKNFVALPVHIFIWQPHNPVWSVGSLPFADAFAGILFPLGLYYYFKFRSLARAKLLGICFIITAILIALDGPVSEALLLPLVYIVVTGGIALLLGQWLTVFPKNPFAKTLGIVLITIAVVMSCVYNLRSYFIAWPNNTETKAEFAKTSENLVQ
jgi:4-amino-4-deoxy-L-arabinose transferase-like glycosyltransferase